MQARGLMYRFFGRFMRSINHTWQLFFVGLVFGIGFDTATEVVLLAATAYAAIQGLPYYAVLALPFLFSGGMMLFDAVEDEPQQSACAFPGTAAEVPRPRRQHIPGRATVTTRRLRRHRDHRLLPRPDHRPQLPLPPTGKHQPVHATRDTRRKYPPDPAAASSMHPDRGR